MRIPVIYIRKFNNEQSRGVVLPFVYVQVVFLCWVPFTGSIQVSPCARWNTTGIIVAGIGGRGDKPDQLSDPNGIFIHKQTNTLYVADAGNERIQMFPLNNLLAMGTTIISNITLPTKIYVDDDNNAPTIYVSTEGENCVKKWIKGASIGVQVGGECFYCTGVWVDKEKNVYMSSAGRHCVSKWSSETKTTTVVAGRENYPGSTSDNLNSPEGIYVDGISGAVYVADYVNNRIQKWSKDAHNGTTVAGLSTGAAGTDAESLSEPISVWVDEETHVVYVADSANERIQRWLHNASMGETIAGGSGMDVEF